EDASHGLHEVGRTQASDVRMLIIAIDEARAPTGVEGPGDIFRWRVADQGELVGSQLSTCCTGGFEDGGVRLLRSDFTGDDDGVEVSSNPEVVEQWPKARIKVAENTNANPCFPSQ